MITCEQVADLQRGDVVELRDGRWPEGSVIRGPLWQDGPFLSVALHIVRFPDGSPSASLTATLTVVSRAPRPLYVNHPRTEPVPGDVVRDADGDWPETWTRNAKGFSNEWLSSRSHNYVQRDELPARLRLLVDGETGMPVGPNLAEAWGDGFEAGSTWTSMNPGPAGGHTDPPSNPYDTGQVVPS